MARYPEAEWLPLPENATEPSIHPTQVILHSAVSNASSLRPYFGRSDVVVESHFYVREDGSVEQYVDTDRQADANYKANARAISIETWDGGDPDRTPWNPAQLDSLTALVRWCCATYGIPARHAPAWDAPGIGGHSDYSQWSNVRGKTCPGLARRPQVPQIIAAAAGSTVLGSRIPDLTTSEEDWLMALTDTQQNDLYLRVQHLVNLFPSIAAVQQYASDGVWQTTVNRATPDGSNKVPALQELADAKTLAIAAQGEAAGLRVAVEALSAGQGVDVDAIRTAARQGVADAMSSIEATVTITAAPKES